MKDDELFFRYHRMTPARFGHLLSVTLRFLATGESQQSLSLSYRIGRNTVSTIVTETCEALFTCLQAEYSRAPSIIEEWQRISTQLGISHFPHVIGAINGKHIRIECPKNSGTLYYKYKGFYSIVLLAVCDANYCFTLFNVGAYGSNNDSGVLANSEMGNRFSDKNFHLPEDQDLCGCRPYKPLPYFQVADDFFPLKSWLMRRYPGNNRSG
ncbi:putative nuclease HARBI1 [Hydractinia symbiolongicarpus]|uniref:putative nuclease HARBI1 n=1 Tax=Hydractinia symbiolongicarpus TaxID=13093 RepID=UPI00255092AF|nr:putative nuclease HARBI1 [Hydractinia symbiolongicarpus]